MDNANSGKKMQSENENETPSFNMKVVIKELERIFKQTGDESGGNLNVAKFSCVMRSFFPTLTDEELVVLHMQIDTSCEGIVNFKELVDFQLSKIAAKQKLHLDNRVFPLPIKMVDTGHYKKIIQIIARPVKARKVDSSVSGLQKYSEEEYVTVTSDGVLNFWTKRFDEHTTRSLFIKPPELPFEQKRRVYVNDMVYMKEREEVAIATRDRELRFYTWTSGKFYLRYAIITEGGRVTALNYWSNGKKAIFSFGDLKGIISVFVSFKIVNALFNYKAFEATNLREYKRVYISSLLRNMSKEFLVVQIPVFNEACSVIKFLPSIEEFAVCADSSAKLALVSLPRTSDDKVSKKIFASPSFKKIFTCVEYNLETEDLITGGIDGILRTWFRYRTESCKAKLSAHTKPIDYLLNNPRQRVVIALHRDQTICVWSLERKTCLQIITAEEMRTTQVSAVYYNLQNNELILANTTIGILLGKGTDVFKDMISSHIKPLCGAIYHDVFEQVISVCQNGLVTVWDTKTGKTITQFNVSPYKLVASTAIALNETKRKLITICNDGRVRFWNFNNGQELKVLPVTVPTMITGIICTEGRVFLSSKDSNIIYNLDLDGKDPTYLKHPLIEGGVTTIALHPKDRWLVTASGNGAILVWDTETYQTLYYFNIKESPQSHSIYSKEYMQVEKKAFLVEYEQIPVSKKLLNAKMGILTPGKVFKSPLVVCMKTRHFAFNLATVLVADKGYVTAWAATMKEGLLAKFKATDGEIMTIETDECDRILMIGDSKGYVHVWDVSKFGDRTIECEGPFEYINNWKVSVSPPPLLSRWKAHKGPIVSITCNPSCENFFTAGFDCNVNVWTNNQRKVGTFGKEKWDINTLHRDCIQNEQQHKTSAGFCKQQDEGIPRKSPDMLKAYKESESFLKNEGQSQKHSKIPEPLKEVGEELQGIYEAESQPHKVRHFLEKKQFEESPRVYNITCPYYGPVGEEHLTEYGADYITTQLTVGPITPHKVEPTPPEPRVRNSADEAHDDQTLPDQSLDKKGVPVVSQGGYRAGYRRYKGGQKTRIGESFEVAKNPQMNLPSHKNLKVLCSSDYNKKSDTFIEPLFRELKPPPVAVQSELNIPQAYRRTSTRELSAAADKIIYTDGYRAVYGINMRHAGETKRSEESYSGAKTSQTNVLQHKNLKVPHPSIAEPSGLTIPQACSRSSTGEPSTITDKRMSTAGFRTLFRIEEQEEPRVQNSADEAHDDVQCLPDQTLKKKGVPSASQGGYRTGYRYKEEQKTRPGENFEDAKNPQMILPRHKNLKILCPSDYNKKSDKFMEPLFRELTPTPIAVQPELSIPQAYSRSSKREFSAVAEKMISTAGYRAVHGINRRHVGEKTSQTNVLLHKNLKIPHPPIAAPSELTLPQACRLNTRLPAVIGKKVFPASQD